jgi:hypothetical protein
VITLDAKDVGRSGAGGRQLPAAAIGKLETRAGIGAGTRGHIPLIGDRNLLGKIQCHCPVAERGGTGVGDAHIHLEESASGIRRRHCAAMRGECMPIQ